MTKIEFMIDVGTRKRKLNVFHALAVDGRIPMDHQGLLCSKIKLLYRISIKKEIYAIVIPYSSIN